MCGSPADTQATILRYLEKASLHCLEAVAARDVMGE
jgi:hypothetical protein